jgi:hypothetical protein
MASRNREVGQIAIPEDLQEGRDLTQESEAWQRAFRYAVRKGNYVPEAPEGRQYRGAVLYADAHAHLHENSDEPVVPPAQVMIVERGT